MAGAGHTALLQAAKLLEAISVEAAVVLQLVHALGILPTRAHSKGRAGATPRRLAAKVLVGISVVTRPQHLLLRLLQRPLLRLLLRLRQLLAPCRRRSISIMPGASYIRHRL